MITKPDKNKTRQKRHRRVRNNISGTAERPRLNVFRSNKNIYAQIIDDVAGVTLASASTLDKEISGGTKTEAAQAVGKLVAERAAEIGKQSFKDGPKLFGIEIMDGEAKIGNNWYEVH